MERQGDDRRTTSGHLGQPAEGPTIVPPSDLMGYEVPAAESATSAGTENDRAVNDDALETDADESRDTRQFSLSGLLGIFTLAAVLLGAGRWLPMSSFAGLMGLGALAMLAVITLLECRRAIVHVAWWVMLALYLGMAIAAFFGR
jgi:hypothetical protein